MTRRQFVMTIGCLSAGAALVHAQDARKPREEDLATVTLIIDGMT